MELISKENVMMLVDNRAAFLGPVLAGAVLSGPVLAPPALAQCDPQEAAKLLADDGAEDDRFGWSIAIDSDTAAIGANTANSVYVFELADGVWAQTAKLTPSDGSDSYFGSAVSVSADAIAVGASSDDDNGVISGSVYLFERIGAEWVESAKLTAPEGEAGDFFGASVAISPDTLVATSPGDDDAGTNAGAAYVYERAGDAWTLATKLTPANAGFGGSVFLGADLLVVGATGDDGVGSVYVYERVGDEWTQTAKIQPDDAGGNGFGNSVSLSGDTILVGAEVDDNNGQDAGAAYVFVSSGGEWTQEAKLLASDGEAFDTLGRSVALIDDIAVVGAHWDDDLGWDAGAAYAFQRVGDDWTEVAKLTPADGAEGDGFGWAIALRADTAFIGATYAEGLQPHSGAVYLFDLDCACPADVNGDGALNVLDFVAFQLLWQDADPGADCDANAEFNVLDFVCFQQLFVQGCP